MHLLELPRDVAAHALQWLGLTGMSSVELACTSALHLVRHAACEVARKNHPRQQHARLGPVRRARRKTRRTYASSCADLRELRRAQRKLSVRLARAANDGELSAVHRLLQAGACASWVLPSGSTPLVLAAQHGHCDVVAALLQAGGRGPDHTKGPDHPTALLLATHWGHTDTMAALLAHGADPNVAVAPPGVTPLFAAAQCNDAEAAKLLLECGAKLLRSTCGATMLFVTAQNGCLETARLLLEAGAHADIDAPWHGATPVFVAALGGHREVAQLLLDAGADYTVNHPSGLSTREAAAAHGFEAIVPAL